MKTKIFAVAVWCLCVLSQVAYAQQGELSVPVSPDAHWDKVSGGLHARWTDTDTQIDKYRCPAGQSGTNSLAFSAWRGERVHARLLVWSSQEEGEVSYAIDGGDVARWVDPTTTGFMRYVMTDELNKGGKGGCGFRPDKTKFDSLLVADRIEPGTALAYEPRTVRPVWITFDVPYDARPATYKGSVRIWSTGSKELTLRYSIRVVNRTMPRADQRKFHLDLWQNPFAVARMDSVPFWSERHFEAMRPVMERLAKAGQRGITATICHRPWNGQTYDFFYNMITEVRRVDGTWSYDFTLFDRYVEFMRSCGVGPYIYCYSVIPWKLTFHYYDQAVNGMVDKQMDVNGPEFDDYWVSKLKAFAAHLKQKGWFDQTIIAMDERPMESMKAALRVIRKADARFKISLAGVYHEELNKEIFDYCIAYDGRYPDGVVEQRRSQGRVSTFYTCCVEAFPNTFTFSQPVEAAAMGVIAAERRLDGYLRWAYNSWVVAPQTDSRFTKFAAGDTFIVYPDNQSSIRLEKLIEGIQLYEKIEVLRAEAKYDKALERLLQPFAYRQIKQTSLPEAIRRLNSFLNSAGAR